MFKPFFTKIYIQMENFVSDNREIFDSTEKFLVEIPDKLSPLFEQITSEKGKGFLSWLTK